MDYLTPGIYVEEAPTGARPIEAVGTSVAAFVGMIPPAAGRAKRDPVVRITTWSQFRSLYKVSAWEEGTALSNAVYGFFMNGGSACYISEISRPQDLATGLLALERYDEISTVAAPGMTDVGDWEALKTHTDTRTSGRVAILDCPPGRVSNFAAPPPAAGGDGDAPAPMSGPFGDIPESDAVSFYYPWIVVRDHSTGRDKAVPPSGHLAGAWARTDAERGVFKAPANIGINGAIRLVDQVSRADQDLLNPKGINCIRRFPDRGILVWGARTRAGQSNPEYRYLPVRRLVNQIRESIQRGTNWVVFEPNDESLWASIRRDVSAFLTRLWRQGALQGSTPDQAFYVRCDSETTTQADIDAGYLIVEIGIAPVKPAEFVVFRISQISEATAATAGQ